MKKLLLLDLQHWQPRYFRLNQPHQKQLATLTLLQQNLKLSGLGQKRWLSPGYFPLKNGTLTMDGGKLTGGKFTIDIAGLKVTDGAGAKLESI
jgi:hypothetical protein